MSYMVKAKHIMALLAIAGVAGIVGIILYLARPVPPVTEVGIDDFYVNNINPPSIIRR